jgi:hypothetical protein
VATEALPMRVAGCRCPSETQRDRGLQPARIRILRCGNSIECIPQSLIGPRFLVGSSRNRPHVELAADRDGEIVAPTPLTTRPCTHPMQRLRARLHRARSGDRNAAFEGLFHFKPDHRGPVSVTTPAVILNTARATIEHRFVVLVPLQWDGDADTCEPDVKLFRRIYQNARSL